MRPPDTTLPQLLIPRAECNNMFNPKIITVDDTAKMRIAMDWDESSQRYFGGVKFPGALNFQRGLSFMFFGKDHAENENRVQEIQVGPTKADRRSRSTRLATAGANEHGDVVIDMHPFLDENEDMGYVGEAQATGTIFCDHGATFILNPSKEGFLQKDDLRGELEIGGAVRGDNLPGIRVPLRTIPRDRYGHPFFVGKLQFPGFLNLEMGVAFRLDRDNLYIEMLEEHARYSPRGGAGTYSRTGKTVIPLMRGLHGEYVGETSSPEILDCTHGYFFTIFTSRPGQEQIQIGRLEHGHQKRRRPDWKEDSRPHWDKVG